MFKIIKPTEAVNEFLSFLDLDLSKPQQRHLTNFVEALLACDGTKTIAKLNRLILDARDQSAFTDFFTYSTWDNDAFHQQRNRALLKWVLNMDQGELIPKPLFISIDDSKSNKPKTSLHFEVVDWHFETNEGRGFGHGVVFVSVHISCGKRSALLNLKIYLRQKTVRRINRLRQKGERIPFKSKYTITREILKELVPLIPKDVPVYVLFDSWYASKKLIKYCRRQGWHVICALKHNRLFKPNGKNDFRSLSRLARYTRTKAFTETIVKTSDSSTRYWAHTKRGCLNEINDEFSMTISKRYHGDKRPAFFLSTDVSLNAREVLTRYGQRWDVEVDHLYLKVHLGLSDFRLRFYEGIARYFDLVGLTLTYLQWRKDKEQGADIKCLSDVIAQHRQEQQSQCLRAFAECVLKKGSVDQALAYWYKQAA